jgi:hypothetical protein
MVLVVVVGKRGGGAGIMLGTSRALAVRVDKVPSILAPD